MESVHPQFGEFSSVSKLRLKRIYSCGKKIPNPRENLRISDADSKMRKSPTVLGQVYFLKDVILL